MSEAWSVEVHDYDDCTHAGFFTTEDEAEGYAARLRMCSAGDTGEVRVIRYVLDRPWRELRGAYCVELSPSGAIDKEGWIDYCAPDHTWDGEHGHLWKSGANGVRAVGYDRAEALARATAI